MYNDIRLEKGMYDLSGKSFTAALEELDPSSAYAVLPSKSWMLSRDSSSASISV